MKASQKRSFVISFRLTPEEVAKIDHVRGGISRNDWCRAQALEAVNLEVPESLPPARLPARRLPTHDRQQLSKILGHLGKVGSNVNQIAKFVNQTKRYPRGDSIVQIQTDLACLKDSVQQALCGCEGRVG